MRRPSRVFSTRILNKAYLILKLNDVILITGFIYLLQFSSNYHLKKIGGKITIFEHFENCRYEEVGLVILRHHQDDKLLWWSFFVENWSDVVVGIAYVLCRRKYNFNNIFIRLPVEGFTAVSNLCSYNGSMFIYFFRNFFLFVRPFWS